MISRAKKTKIIDDLKDIITESKSVIFTDFAGLTTSALNELKGLLREKGIGYKITKKSLWPFAIKISGSNIDLDFSEHKGSVGAAYGPEEGVEAAKIIKTFKQKHENFTVLGGLLEKAFVGPEKITTLASLPSREELLATVVGMFNSPRQGFVNVLSGNIKNLISVINNIKDKKQ